MTPVEILDEVANNMNYTKRVGRITMIKRPFLCTVANLNFVYTKNMRVSDDA